MLCRLAILLVLPLKLEDLSCKELVLLLEAGNFLLLRLHPVLNYRLGWDDERDVAGLRGPPLGVKIVD